MRAPDDRFCEPLFYLCQAAIDIEERKSGQVEDGGNADRQRDHFGKIAEAGARERDRRKTENADDHAHDGSRQVVSEIVFFRHHSTLRLLLGAGHACRNDRTVAGLSRRAAITSANIAELSITKSRCRSTVTM